MSRPVKKLSKYFRRHVGARFNPLFRSNITCGVIVDIDDVFDIDYVDSLSSFGITLPEVQDGTASLPGLNSLRDVKLSGKAAAELPTAIPVDAEIGGAINSARHISMSFSDVTMKYLNRYPLEISIREGLETADHGSYLLEYLRDHDHHIVVATYSGVIKVHFEGSGGGSINAAAEVPKVGSAGFEAGWKWSDEGTLMSNEPVNFAFETCEWRRYPKKLRETS